MQLRDRPGGVASDSQQLYFMLVDFSRLLEKIDGDEKLMRHLARLFLQESPEMVETIRACIEAGNADALEHAAHNLKGSVGILQAGTAFEACSTLERMARDGNLTGAGELLQTITCEVEAINRELKSLIDRETPIA